MKIAKRRCLHVFHRIQRNFFVSLLPMIAEDTLSFVNYSERTFAMHLQFDGEKWIPLLDSSSS